jgi:hypothetical protein
MFVRALGADDRFLNMVALTVAAIAEGLPAILTITPAIEVRWMPWPSCRSMRRDQFVEDAEVAYAVIKSGQLP